MDKYNKDKDAILNIRVDAETRSRITEHAFVENTTISKIVREALKKAFGEEEGTQKNRSEIKIL